MHKKNENLINYMRQTLKFINKAKTEKQVK